MNFCEVADYSQRSGCVIDGDITAGYHGKMEPWHDFIFLFICLCLFFKQEIQQPMNLQRLMDSTTQQTAMSRTLEKTTITDKTAPQKTINLH